MSVRKVKSPSKMFTSDLKHLENTIVKTIDKISNIVGASLGPGGRNIIIESDLAGIPNKNTKDGVSIFRSLGSNHPYEHLIIEQTRDVAIRTVNEAGDGTTTATIISSALIKNLFNFCKENIIFKCFILNLFFFSELKHSTNLQQSNCKLVLCSASSYFNFKLFHTIITN